MSHKRLYACLGFLCVAVAASISLQAKDDRYEWPSIAPEELAASEFSGAPGAHAVILFLETRADDIKGEETHYYRIKILSDEGKKFANVEIPYVEKYARIEDIRARTLRPDGTAVDFRGQVFDKDLIKYRKARYQAKTFTLPEVQRGCIVEYSYTMHSRQHQPDVLKHPANYIIRDSFSFPSVSWTIQRDLFTRKARFTLRPIPTAFISWSWLGLPKGTAPRSQPDGTVLLELENVPAFQAEEYMPPEDLFRGQVDFHYVVGPAGTIEGFWAGQAREQAEVIQKFLGKQKNLEPAVAEIVAPNDESEAKLRKLYARVQKIRYLSYEQPKSEKEEKGQNLKDNKLAEDVWKRGYAYGNEINLLFVAMARVAGFDASVALIAARDRNFFNRNTLDPRQLNAMVVLVHLGSQELYFDPATLHCPFKILPWEETATEGIRSDAKSSVFVSTPVPTSAEAVVRRTALLTLESDGNLRGTLKVSFAGQEALRRRLQAHGKDGVARSKGLEDEVKSRLPEGSTVKLEGPVDWESSSEILRAEFSLRIPGAAAFTGRRVLLPLAVFQFAGEHLFQHAKRLHPIYFKYPFQELDEVSVRLPAGCKVEQLPKPRKSTPDFASYEISYENQGDVLRMQRKLVMEKFFFHQDSYPRLRNFYNGVRTADEEQVVLVIDDAGQTQ